MVKFFKFDENALVTMFGNFGDINSFVITIANVRHITRGLHGVTLFDNKGNKYSFECNEKTRFIVDGIENKELNNAYNELYKEMEEL